MVNRTLISYAAPIAAPCVAHDPSHFGYAIAKGTVSGEEYGRRVADWLRKGSDPDAGTEWQFCEARYRDGPLHGSKERREPVQGRRQRERRTAEVICRWLLTALILFVARALHDGLYEWGISVLYIWIEWGFELALWEIPHLQLAA